MATTIQLHEHTVQLLKELKRKFGTRSYDEVVNRLIFRHSKMPKSMFGSNPRLTPFREDDRIKLREYR